MEGLDFLLVLFALGGLEFLIGYQIGKRRRVKRIDFKDAKYKHAAPPPPKPPVKSIILECGIGFVDIEKSNVTLEFLKNAGYKVLVVGKEDWDLDETNFIKL